DGIRDRNVTGVQTCALPISLEGRGFRRVVVRCAGAVHVDVSDLLRTDAGPPQGPAHGPVSPLARRRGCGLVKGVVGIGIPREVRSEERRVGQGWGYVRWQ